MDLFFSPLACSMSARIASPRPSRGRPCRGGHTGRAVVATGEDYRAIHALGVVPALRLDDGTVITENAAILQYIADEHPAAGLAPPVRSPRAGEAQAMAELHRDRAAQGADDAAARQRDAAGGQGVDGAQIRIAPRLSRRQTRGARIPARPVQRRRRLSGAPNRTGPRPRPKSTSRPTRTSKPISNACASAPASPRLLGSLPRCSGPRSRAEPLREGPLPHRLRHQPPVLATQSLYAVEFASIPCDDHEASTARMAGDQHVVAADRAPVSFQRRADVGGMMSRGDVVGQDFEALTQGSYPRRRLASDRSRADFAARHAAIP